MHRRPHFVFGFLLVLGCVLGSVGARAATPVFTVSVTNVTMPSSGNGSIPFTLASVDGYTGSIVVQCPKVDAPVAARVPTCGAGGPILAYDLGADGTVKASLTLLPYGDTAPLPAEVSQAPRPQSVGFAVAGVLLLGVGWRRRRDRWGVLVVLGAGALASFGLLGCAGGTPGMTPGTYAYTVVATDIKTNAMVSTTANVIVR